MDKYVHIAKVKLTSIYNGANQNVDNSFTLDTVAILCNIILLVLVFYKVM